LLRQIGSNVLIPGDFGWGKQDGTAATLLLQWLGVLSSGSLRQLGVVGLRSVEIEGLVPFGLGDVLRQGVVLNEAFQLRKGIEIELDSDWLDIRFPKRS
jgi:hypothetical protein